MNGTNPATIDAQILEVVVAPDEPTMSASVAWAVTSLKFSSDQETEIRKLLDKNNSGTITTKELDVLDGYVRVGNFLNLLKAKARTSLTKKPTKR